MRISVTGACLAALGGVAVAAVPLGSAVGADQARLRATAAYTCAFSDSLGEDAVELAMDLRAPATARPGQTLEVSGELVLTFSETAARQAQLTLSRQATLTSETMSVLVTAGQDERAVPVPAVESEQTPVEDTLVVRAPIRVAGIVVPTDATGGVRLALPGNGYTSNTVGSSPAMVAFTAALELTGGLPQTRRLACRLPDSDSGRLGQVPIRSAGASTPAPASAPVAAAPGGALPGLGSPASGGGLGLGPAAPLAPSPVEAAAGVPVLADARPVFAPIPQATRTDGVVAPVWAVVLAGVAALLGCTAMVVRGRRQLARLRKRTR